MSTLPNTGCTPTVLTTTLAGRKHLKNMVSSVALRFWSRSPLHENPPLIFNSASALVRRLPRACTNITCHWQRQNLKRAEERPCRRSRGESKRGTFSRRQAVSIRRPGRASFEYQIAVHHPHRVAQK